MGCKGSFTNGDGLCEQENHCGRYVPAAADRAIDIEFNEYPLSEIRSQSNINYQIEKRDGVAVMYPSMGIREQTGGGFADSGPTCGKVYKDVNCAFVDRYVYDYVPDELSFDLGFSDRYFSYLYDTSANAGHVGIACYYLQSETRGNTISGATTTEEGMICKP